MTNTPSTATRLQSLLNVIPYPGVQITVDADTFQLLTDLHAHFAACEDLIQKDQSENDRGNR